MTFSASPVHIHISSNPSCPIHLPFILELPSVINIFLYAHENPRLWKSGMLLTTVDSPFQSGLAAAKYTEAHKQNFPSEQFHRRGE